MNTFKFRAWDTKNKKWITSKHINYSSIPVKPTKYGFELKSKFILSQWTGLKDGKGQDIYNGDILKTDEGKPYENNWETVFENGAFSLIDAKRQSDTYGVFTRRLYTNIPSNDKYKIIGNIYDNPELLKPT